MRFQRKPYFWLRVAVRLLDLGIFLGGIVLLYKVLKVPSDLPYWRALVGGVILALIITADKIIGWIRADIRKAMEELR